MSQPESPAAITRIARRKALPGHASQYEALVREMFTLMRNHEGFLGAEIIPPETEDDDHQIVVRFESEADLAAWDSSADRRHIFAKMREHAEGDPQHRRLNVLEEWFVGPSVPAATRPPRWKTAIVTWMGIWPLASLAIYFLSPLWSNLGFPFLLSTAINVVFIVAAMTFVVAPWMTKLMRWFLVPKKR